MKLNEKQDDSQQIFFKQFFLKNPHSSPRNITTFHQQSLNRPQNNSLTSINKMVNLIKSKSKDNKKSPEMQDRLLRKSVTQEKKRSKIHSPDSMPKQFNLIFNNIKSKTTEFVRSKGKLQEQRSNESQQKGIRAGRLNEKLKQNKNKTLNRLFNQTYNSKSQVTNYVNIMGTIAKNSTLPLHTQYKSYKALQPKLINSKTPFQISQSSECLKSNLLNPQANSRKSQSKRREGCDSAKRFYLKLKKNRIGLLFTDQNINQKEEQSINRQVPYELGINKIMLPKRNYRHQFLQNIQKIKEGYLKIKGNGQKQPIPIITPFERRPVIHDKIKKTYEVKYRKTSPRKEEKIQRSKTEFLHNRMEWQTFINDPLSPWDTQQPKGR